MMKNYKVSADMVKKRLDKALVDLLEDKSRAYILKCIEEEHILTELEQ